MSNIKRYAKFEKQNLLSPENSWALLKKMPDTPDCFCRQPARTVNTQQCGRVLVCTQKTHLCGFHVHLETWNEFREQLKEQKLDLFHPQLSCPYFNFTFCTIFEVKNKLEMSTPKPPHCLCSKPLVLHMFRIKNRYKSVFVCCNYFDDNRCSIFFNAKDVIFERDDTTEMFTPEKRLEVNDINIKEIQSLISTYETQPELETELETATETGTEIEAKPEYYHSVVTRNVIYNIPRSTKNEMIKKYIEEKTNELKQLYDQQKREILLIKQDVRARKETINNLMLMLDIERQEHIHFKKESEEIIDSLQDAIEKMKACDGLVCTVCFQNKIEIAFEPCFHFACCINCADRLHICPICRTVKERNQRIYLP